MTQEPIIFTKNGAVKGSIKSDYQGNTFYSFQGIPYAKPPVGELRFKPPQPVESWTEIRDATKEGNVCYSINTISQTPNGSEDCLFLNVYTKKQIDKRRHPVMFWIHGGGFSFGSGNSDVHGPEYLLSEDVVLVTINYRLGLLGFLSLDDTSLGITGNAGLKDQVMALKWVNENISNFGGDPNNVTIFGLSAGSASVHYLILSPLAKGLFHKAILQSGTALAPWALCNSPKSAIAEKLSMTNATDLEILKVLLAMPVEKLFELQQTLPDEYSAYFQRILGPVVESPDAETPFLTEKPVDILQSGNYNHVPIMIGFTSRDGMIVELRNRTSGGAIKFNMSLEAGIPYDLQIPTHHEMYKPLYTKVKNFYYGSQELTPENVNQYYLLQGDVLFVFPAYRTIKYHNSASSEPIFLYRISVESELNYLKKFGKFTCPGVCHGDDLGYLFKNMMPISILPNSVEEKSIKTFIKLWTQFATTGNPNLSSEDDIVNINWKSIERDRFHYLEIGENVTAGLNPDYNRIKFWESIYAQSDKHYN